MSTENAVVHETRSTRTLRDPESGRGHRPPHEPGDASPAGTLIRLLRPVAIRPGAGTTVDSTIVGPQFYDCFNYSLLTGGEAGVNVTVGVSSANPREGKTLVASNLAISLTVAYQRKTVLVDMNVQAPRLHTIFGVGPGPGLMEAISGGPIEIARTAVEDLFVLTAGVERAGLAGALPFALAEDTNAAEPSLQLEQIAAFRDILYSLKEQFDFVIIDMPSLREHLIPLLFTNQLDGVLMVVHGGITKQGDLDHALQIVNERRVLGFVYNGVERGRPGRRWAR